MIIDVSTPEALAATVAGLTFVLVQTLKPWLGAWYHELPPERRSSLWHLVTAVIGGAWAWFVFHDWVSVAQVAALGLIGRKGLQQLVAPTPRDARGNNRDAR